MKLLEPIVQLVGRLSFRNKLRATALLFGIPLLVMTGLLLTELNARVSSLKQEQSSLSVQVQTLSLLGNLHQFSAALQGIDEGAIALEPVVEVKRIQALNAVDRLEKIALERVLAETPTPRIWLGHWSELKAEIKTADLQIAQDLIAAIRAELEELNEASGLLSDGDADSARLLDVVTTHLPGLVETTGQAAEVGTVVLAKQSIRGSRRNELTLYRGNFDSLVLWSLDSLRKVGQANTKVAPELEAAASQLNTAYASLQEAITIKMLDTTDFSMAPVDYLAVVDRAMSETLAVSASLVKSTETLFADRLLVLEIKRNFVIVTIALGLAVVLAGFSAAYISIMRGLRGLSDAVGTMAAGDLDARVNITTKDELGDVGQRFNEMAEKLAQRTVELAEKTNHIHGMLQSLPQGVMTITQGLMIHPEYSAHLKTIMETDSLADLPALEVVCGGADVGADTMAQQYATLSACMGEDRMNFDFNEHLLLTEIRKTMPDGRVKTLELLWAPICDDGDVVEKIMLSVRDVSHLRALEAEAQSQKRELELIGQVLKVNQEKFHEFVDSARGFVAQNRELLTQTRAFNPELITQLFRNMHTIKGNARTYGLLHMTNVVHEAEQAYDDLRNNLSASFEPNKLLAQLAVVEQKLEEYAHINEHVLGRKGPGRRGAAEKYLMVERAGFEAILQQINAYDLHACRQETLAALLEDLKHELGLMGTESVPHVLDGVFESLPSLAGELGKTAPVVTVADHGVVVKNQISDLLRNVFMHLYRNSMDHGIELPEERQRKGKSAAGKIHLAVSLTSKALTFDLQDDGKGLALGYIRGKGVERGLISMNGPVDDQKTANLIFAAGFSTASKVTEVSGRGVGMDAVQAFLKREGGSIELLLTDDKTGADYRQFVTRITLPAAFAVDSTRRVTAPLTSRHHTHPAQSLPHHELPEGLAIHLGLGLQGA
ncbi:MAG: hypothetical protein RIR18_164 [Pseudomonadota bacterium]|jgi:two-component system chemotaxis sensor kinase CheA